LLPAITTFEVTQRGLVFIWAVCGDTKYCKLKQHIIRNRLIYSSSPTELSDDDYAHWYVASWFADICLKISTRRHNIVGGKSTGSQRLWVVVPKKAPKIERVHDSVEIDSLGAPQEMYNSYVPAMANCTQVTPTVTQVVNTEF
jgi:hypothetical protein